MIAGERIRNFIPSYTLTNARLTWQNADEDLDVSLEATNVFDKYYLLTIFDLRGAGAGFRKGRPGNPHGIGGLDQEEVLMGLPDGDGRHPASLPAISKEAVLA